MRLRLAQWRLRTAHGVDAKAGNFMYGACIRISLFTPRVLLHSDWVPPDPGT